MINHLLSRSAEFERNLLEFLVLLPFDDSQRIMVSRVMCSIAFEHAESAKMLISAGNLTSATGLVRLQYEALVRAMRCNRYRCFKVNQRADAGDGR